MSRWRGEREEGRNFDLASVEKRRKRNLRKEKRNMRRRGGEENEREMEDE